MHPLIDRIMSDVAWNKVRGDELVYGSGPRARARCQEDVEAGDPDAKILWDAYKVELITAKLTFGLKS